LKFLFAALHLQAGVKVRIRRTGSSGSIERGSMELSELQVQVPVEVKTLSYISDF
jgi:hypothetical protein